MIGSIIISTCIKFFNVISKEHRKIRNIGNRTYIVYKITSNDRMKLTLTIFNVLRTSNISSLSYVQLARTGKSVLIKLREHKPLWYRIGFSLSDGSLLNNSKIIFSTTNPHTLNAIVYGFNDIRLYIARYIVSTVTGKLMPVINIIVNDVETAMWVYKVKTNKDTIKYVANNLKSNNEKLAEFLAGVIEGDGTIDRDNVRISISKTDPLYKILTEIFGNAVKFDSKRYMLRISTSKLKNLGVLNAILNLLASPLKRGKLETILRKRRRAYIPPISLPEERISEILAKPSITEKTLLQQFKFRSHGKYRYAYISVRKEKINNILKEVSEVLLKISNNIGVDLSKSVREGNREVIIYNQHVVRLIEKLKMNLEEGR